MTRMAFDYSERMRALMIRVTTRLAHARALIGTGTPRPPNALCKSADPKSWILMPANAKRQWKVLLEKNERFKADAGEANKIALRDASLGVVTCGLGLRYYLENEDDWAAAHGGARPSHLHIGRYPNGYEKLRVLAGHVRRLLVIEEGYPFVEREIRGVFSAPVPVLGKISGEIPLDGELSADSVRAALGLAPKASPPLPEIRIPTRPPQFCMGCPHADSINALKEALKDEAEFFTASDIGCISFRSPPTRRSILRSTHGGPPFGMARARSGVGQKRPCP